MDYESFKDTVLHSITEYLPEELQTCQVKLETVRKVNVEKEAMTVRFGHRGLRLYLEETFLEYKAGQAFVVLMERMAMEITNAIKDTEGLQGQLETGGMLQTVVLQLVCDKWNKELLEDVPHRKFLDMSIVYRVLLESRNDSRRSILVTNTLMNKFGVTEEQLYRMAKVNTKRLLPTKAFDFGYEFCQMVVLTNSNSFYGASCMLDTETLEKVAEAIDDDIYLLPSSQHEVLAVPCKEYVQHDGLQQIVREVNDSTVAKEDWLSDQVYMYSRQSKEVSLVCQ